MSSLDRRFLDTIKLAGKDISGRHKAYKMDNTAKGRDMRIAAGLGTCHCCDYFLARGDSIVLIEETQLLGERKDIQMQYADLNPFALDLLVKEILRYRMQLKVYGAMLTLCRLAAKCTDAKNILQNKKCSFWLVVSALNTADDLVLFDNLKDYLRSNLNLTSLLGTESLNKVEVIPSGSLADILSSANPAR